MDFSTIKKDLIYIGIVFLILIGMFIFWPKNRISSILEDPTLVLLRQQTIKDSLEIVQLNKVKDSLKVIIKDKEVYIASLKQNITKIEYKYDTQKQKLSKLSTPEMLDSFIEQTGGRVDSIYSLPRMNLLNALEIFITAEKLSEIASVQSNIISSQDSTIKLQRLQVYTMEETDKILINSLDLHKTTVGLQAKKIIALERSLKKKTNINRILVVTTAVTSALLIIK